MSFQRLTVESGMAKGRHVELTAAYEAKDQQSQDERNSVVHRTSHC